MAGDTRDSQESVGKKYDIGKLRYDLIPPDALRLLADVLTYGASKYGDRNWEKGIEPDRLYAATMRHLEVWREGEDIDVESGRLHLSLALTELMMLLTLVHRRGRRPL